jgi:acetyltransferase
MFPLDPKSIAVIGASDDLKKLGFAVLNNLITQGYKGKIFPINPNHASILDHQAYKSITDVPESIDLAVIVTPAATVNQLIDECGQKKVKACIVISAGFSELHGDEGKKREEELIAIAKQHEIQLIGPNCLGILRPALKMNASFAADLPQEGSIALLSQSGALAVALMDASDQYAMGYSLIVSMGNKAVMDECDFLEICEHDEKTQVIGLYLESVKDGQRFRTIAKRVATKKPIVLIKAGVSERGKRAVSSHTGALAGTDAAIDALCTQTGIRRAHNAQEFLDLLRTISTQPTLLTNRIGIITNAGGPGVLATDSTEPCGLMLAELSEKTKKTLQTGLPEAASVENPVDVLGDADAKRYVTALAALASDASVDGILVIATPQVMTPLEDIANMLLQESKKYSLVPLIVCFMGQMHTAKATERLQKAGIPTFSTPEAALIAMRSLLHQEEERPASRKKKEDGKEDDRSSMAHQILKNQSGLLDEETVRELFDLFSLPTIPQMVAQTEKEAVSIAEELGYPVIAKVSSPDILHKTDLGGVSANLKNADDVKKAFRDISANVMKHAPTAGIHGIAIQEFLPIGHEFIVGAVRDPSFGPLVMVGLGGIYTELMKDTALRIAPISLNDAYAMLEELQSWTLLLGLRGEKQLNIPALAEMIVTVSDMMLACQSIQELDLNPVLVSSKEILIADTKVVIAHPSERRVH